MSNDRQSAFAEKRADAPRLVSTVVFVYFVVQILFVIGLRAKSVLGPSW